MLAPVVFVFVVELAFRFFDTGLPTGFLRTLEIRGEKMLVENDAFGLRFFSPSAARAPDTIIVPARKDDELRVVVLGESAAMGDPMPEYGAARMLEVLLQSCFPERRVRVVNAAMTAINSHVIREIARDLKRLQPDVAIVMMGNNEVLGPFGPSALESSGRLLPGWRIRAHTMITRLRLVEWLSSLKLSLNPAASADDEWIGLQAFATVEYDADAPVRDAVRTRFRENLGRIVTTLQRNGSEVLLCTIPVNLGDWPPFAANTRDDNFQMSTWRAQATTAMQAREWDKAILLWRNLLEARPHDAGAMYGLTHTYFARGDLSEALPLFSSARDTDRLPFRTDSYIQAIIRDTAQAHSGGGVSFIDLEKRWADHSNPVVLDVAGFVDHVHFSWRGNFWIARQWAATILGGMGMSDREARLPEERDVALKLAATSAGQRDFYQQMPERFDRPPFNAMPGLQAHRARYRAAIDELNALPEQVRDADEAMLALHAGAHDFYVLVRLAQLQQSRKQVDEANRLARLARESAPHSIDVAALVTQQLFAENRVDEAIALFDRALFVNPYARSVIANKSAVEFLVQCERPAAETVIHWAVEHTKLNAVRAAELVEVLLRRGWFEEAHDVAGELYERYPRDMAVALYRCKTALALKHIDEAARALARAVSLAPDDVEVEYHRGVVRFEQGHPDEALEHFINVVSKDPAHKDAPGQWASLMLDYYPAGELEKWIRTGQDYTPVGDALWLALVRNLEREGDWLRARRLLAMAGASSSGHDFHKAIFAWVLLHDSRSPDDRTRGMRLVQEVAESDVQNDPFVQELLAFAGYDGID